MRPGKFLPQPRKRALGILYAVALALALGLGAPFSAKACTAASPTDWTRAPHYAAAPVWPPDCAVVEQTPPDLTWPDYSDTATYQVTLTYPNGRSKTLNASHNWLAWNEALPAGTYTWRVQATSGTSTVQSNPRTFTVSSTATPFLVPSGSALLSRAAAKPHPRTLPESTALAIMLSQRQEGVRLLLADVDARLGGALRGDPASSIEETAKAESEQLLNTAFAYLATRNEKYFVEAVRRAMNLAAWDPSGATSYARQGPASRQIALSLTLAYDWLYGRLNSEQRATLLHSIRVRTNDMYNRHIGAGRPAIAQRPHDSHGAVSLTRTAMIATALASDLPDAQTWFRGAVPLAIHWTSAWGREDGGFGNGSAQATADLGELLIPWYVWRWTLGIDMAQKPWVRNHVKYRAYLLPPGSTVGAFGDGAERDLRESQARFGKAYAYFAPTPLSRWYAAQLAGEDPKQLELLLAPPADFTSASYPSGTANAELFRSVGQAAFHSNLSDQNRVSVFFKSSPFGAFNHSHGDQNSFTVSAAGKPLAIDSGYYDGYKTPHWQHWYRATRAHNAMTFDGGIGQVIDDSASRGRNSTGAITRYFSNGYQLVTGDAVQAYGGALTKAQRTLVYLPGNLILVYDDLASPLARQWEWNIHAVNVIKQLAPNRIAIENGGQTLCAGMIAGPQVGFRQTNAWTSSPSGPQFADYPDQWHGSFYTTTKSTSAELVALLKVGCATVPATIKRTGTGYTVTLPDHIVNIASGTVSVMPRKEAEGAIK